MRTMRVICLLILTAFMLIAASCKQQGRTSSRSNAVVSNTSSTLNIGHGRVLASNPVILSGSTTLDPLNLNRNQLLTNTQNFITNSQFLIGSCQGISSCYTAKADQGASLLNSVDDRWGFEANSSEFLQVHTFYHVNKAVEHFHSNLKEILAKAQPSVDPALHYQTAIPQNLFKTDGNGNTTNYSHWAGTKELLVFSGCNMEDNAYFSPANFSLCFGKNSANNLHFAEDPSVIYHELGHTFAYIMLNLRNTDAGLAKQANLGYLGYDDAGAIGEGVADYLSYMITQRTHVGEWAMGFYDGSRPLSEDDPIHAANISTADDQRLAYPQYLSYNPNFPTEPLEDIHYDGQIASHYLVALTEQLMSSCSQTQTQAISNMLYLLAETFGYLGDLTTYGNDYIAGQALTNSTSMVNLDGDNIDNAALWLRAANPINFRTFFQTLARYTYLIFNTNSQCNGGALSKDTIEQLLDNYGLLLFDDYNLDGNDATNGHLTRLAVTAANRVKTERTTKELLSLDPSNNATTAYIFDKRSDILTIIEGMQASGQVTSKSISSQIESDLRYNNGNGSISPGEIVGVALNLYNNSNITMAGVQVLANDWDHFDGTEPCNNFSDNFPLSSAGAALSSSLDPATATSGTCPYITQDNGQTGSEIAPVCMLELSEDGNTIWSSQSGLIDQIGLDSASCLGGISSTNDCFIRFIPGAEISTYSKLSPHSNWPTSLSTSSGIPTFESHGLLFMEVSPWIPPGTSFRCRVRTRFTNCNDCFTDSTQGNDDFLDYEYSGGDPFKIIHFSFTVID
ncbi:MAG: hypothetical protein HN730_11185 [Bdellovibrionales bacterium]|nr:hypothetical protein [Bdellovibrionales bacterium]